MTAAIDRQNYAVMNQRHSDRSGIDDFPTPPWATRALCEHPWFAHSIANSNILEPAAGRGYMAYALRGYIGPGKRVVTADIVEYEPALGGYYGKNVVQDFLDTKNPVLDALIGLDGGGWVITNPPFKSAASFARQALRAKASVAFFVRLNWLESEERYELFDEFPLSAVLPFSSRVGLKQGECSPLVSTATAYCWVVWHRTLSPATTHIGFPFCGAVNWIQPTARRLNEYEYDYPGFTATGRSPLTGRLIWKPNAA